ncbi:MAG: hypothetical protein K2I06_09620 [Ruminococcus sp.]|nr:hypothetical protein [Ruminococcus sp.]
MKKIIALLTFMAVLCSFTSCGQDSADEVTEESSVISVDEKTEDSAEETTEETDDSETEEIVSEDTDREEVSETENTDETANENSEYQKVIDSFLEYTQNKDIDGMIKLSYPDKYCDTVKALYEMGISSPPCLDLSETITFTNFTLINVDSLERLSQEYISLFDGNYGMFQPISEYIEQNGTENTDELNKVIEEAQNTPQEAYFHVEDAFSVNCILHREPIDPSEFDDDSDYDEFIDYEFTLYYIDGEGWKIDYFLMPYIYALGNEAVANDVYNIYAESETVLTELDEEGSELPENCIISSDSSKNYNVNDEFADMFVNRLNEYYQSDDIPNYFVLIENNEISCVVGTDGKLKYVWAFPPDYMYNEDDYMMSYDENYQMRLDKIK